MGCLPYKDCFFISAQVLSIFAFLFSVGTYFSLIVGLAATITLQICWCCRVSKKGIITAGVFACIAGIVNLIAGIAFIASSDSVCYGGGNDDYYNDDAYCNYVAWASVAFVGCVLWAITAAGVFSFCGRIDDFQLKHPDDAVAVDDGVEAVELRDASKVAADTESPRVSCKKTITYTPDGSKSTKCVTHNEDGSQTVTETIEMAEP